MSEDTPHAAARRAPDEAPGGEPLRAAFERMRAALSRDGDTLERLRSGLADLALAVARAKAGIKGDAIEPEAGAAGKGIDVAALLDEFEARLAGLMALIDGPGRAPAVP